MLTSQIREKNISNSGTFSFVYYHSAPNFPLRPKLPDTTKEGSQGQVSPFLVTFLPRTPKMQIYAGVLFS